MIYTYPMENEDQNLSRKIRLKNFVLPVLLILLIVQQVVNPDRAWEILLYVFGGTFLLSAVWAVFLWKGLTFNRKMRQGWAQVGDKFSEQFIIFNPTPFAASVVSFIDHSNLPGYRSSVAWYVDPHFEKIWYMDSICFTRGLYQVGPTEIKSNDPFGVFEITVSSKQSREILVTPPIVPLLQVEITSGEWHGNTGSKTKMFARTVTAAGVREYAPGDTLFSVHWLTSARRDDLFVRTFDQQPSSDWWIFLDMERRVQLGEGLETTDEYSAMLAASIADRGLKESRAVGLVGAGSRSVWLPPKTGSGQRSEIMHTLAVIDRGQKPLKDHLARAQRSLGRNSSAIVVTPSVSTDWLPTLAALTQRGVAATVLLLNPLDFGGTKSPRGITKQLDLLGIRYYLINKSIYQQPKVHEYLPNQWAAYSRIGVE